MLVSLKSYHMHAYMLTVIYADDTCMTFWVYVLGWYSFTDDWFVLIFIATVFAGLLTRVKESEPNSVANTDFSLWPWPRHPSQGCSVLALLTSEARWFCVCELPCVLRLAAFLASIYSMSVTSLSPFGTTKHISGCCHISLWGQNWPHLRTSNLTSYTHQILMNQI